jgi:hypothetical protein
MDQQVLQKVLAEINTPIFLAGYDQQQSHLMLHVSEGRDVASLEAAAKRASDKAEAPIRISVRTHRLRKLAHPRSLEHWLQSFEADEIVYDPTMVMSRARALLLAAKSCRSELGAAIAGLFFDPDRRTLFVLYSGKTDAMALAARVRSVIEKSLDQATAQVGSGAANRFWTGVQVVGTLPHRELIPIDAKSASLVRGAQRAVRRWFAPIAVALALVGIGVAPAAASADPTGRHQTISGKAEPAQNKFGVLSALSVFSDNVGPRELHIFASAGLQQYFGERTVKGVQLAAYKHKRLKRIEETPKEQGRGPERGQGVGGS